LLYASCKYPGYAVRKAPEPQKEGGLMTTNDLHVLEGRQVSVALRNGSRIDDCQLVSAPRARTETMWLFSNGDDLFVSVTDVLDVWEVACSRRAA
jgi:hypothetical protein